MRLLPVACLALGLAACTETGTPTASMPTPGAPGTSVTSDPIRDAAFDANDFFARPQAGQPARAARAIADIEYLAEVMPSDPRYQTSGARGLTELQIARREARSALGIPRNAASADVVRGLRDASAALQANNRPAAEAALPRNVFTLGPAQTIQRLSQPPRVPSARGALTGLASPGR